MPTSERPNIVEIIWHDLGDWLSCYGREEIPSPSLQTLAEEGVVFDHHFCSAPQCSPSRSSILTGLYPHQAGVGGMTKDLGTPAYQGYLNDSCITIAEALKAGGYQTYMSGKLHCGGSYNVCRPETWSP